MREQMLHITNGDCFNDYFVEKYGEPAVPFREAMMDGDGTSPIFSDAFIRKRCEVLGISEDEYRSDLGLLSLLEKKPERICLWFGTDTFCQMNLLTLLAYLEQIGFEGEVELQRIDDESFSEIGEREVVKLGLYEALYKEILMEKKKPSALGCLEERAVALYFDYRSPRGFLASLIRENAELDEIALVCLLLEKSAEYGLSDLQAKKLIRRYRAR